MKMTGAEILIECLKEQEVDTIFGFPGGAVLYIYDALFTDGTINHVLTCHEQAAAHGADGYARATGKVGVCLATSGPGATNLVTGIATAYMDSVPMVAITGNVSTALLGKDSFQEVDIAGVTMPITKHNYIVDKVENLADIVREAFHIANEGRPGPVLIDIPKNITSESAEYVAEKPKKIKRKTSQITDESIGEAVRLIKKAKKPMILSGGGVIRAEATKEMMKFAEKTKAPVSVTLMGQSLVPHNNPHYIGLIGMHGTKTSNIAASQCDLLIVVGARFSDRVTGKTGTFAQNATILHIDIDPAEINKNVKAHHAVIGDVKESLIRINEELEEAGTNEWFNLVSEWKKEYPLSEKGFRPAEILGALTELTKGEAIIVTEVGQHQMWAAQYYSFQKPGSLLTSGGLGTMGYGTGAAVGAKIGAPERTVVSVAGDGSLRMNMQEISTAAKLELPLVILLMNNHTLGMVRQWQNMFYGKRYSHTTLDYPIDWSALAAALGGKGLTMGVDDDPKTVLKEALASKGPVLVNCEIPTDDKVFPMVPPGAPITEVIMDDDD